MSGSSFSRRGLIAGSATAASLASLGVYSVFESRDDRKAAAPSPSALFARTASAVEVERLFIQAASGQVHDLENLTYVIDRPVVVAAGGGLRGPGRLSLAPDFIGQWAVEFTAGAASKISNVEIDGAAVRATVVSAIRANGSTSGLSITGCNLRNLPFDGIDVSGGAGAYRHDAPVIADNTIENVGWVAVNIEAARNARVSGNRVSRTGYHGVSVMLGCTGARVVENQITKSRPPTRIFAGQGSLQGAEGGFMIAFDPSVDDIVIERNVCDDNRNAAQDGIGVGEDGRTFGRSRIADNVVRRAGLFGIDAPGNCVVERNLVEGAAQQGIHVGLDLGGLIENVVVRNNIIRDTGDVASRVQTFGILVGDTHGSPIRMHNVAITANTVADTRDPPRTDYGVAIVSDEARYENLTVEDNDLSQVRISSLIWIGSAGPGPGFRGQRNRCATQCTLPPHP